MTDPAQIDKQHGRNNGIGLH